MEENLLGPGTEQESYEQVMIGNINHALNTAKGFGGGRKATNHHWAKLMALAKERKHFFTYFNVDKILNDSNCQKIHSCVWERKAPC